MTTTVSAPSDSARAGAAGGGSSSGGWTLPEEPRTYGNWRRPVSPGLPGLGLLGTVALLCGGVLVVLVQMAAGLRPAAATLLLVAVLVLPLLYRDRSGRNGWQALTVRLLWLRGRRRGQALYRSGLLGPGTDTVRTHPAAPTDAPAAAGAGSLVAAGRRPVPSGAHMLPGLLAASQVYEAVDAFGQPFALLHIPATRHYSVVLRCEPEGNALVDPETSDVCVALWGRWLAELSREPGLDAASATVETAPDPGSALHHEVERLLAPGAPALARAALLQAADSSVAASPQVTGRVCLTFTASRPRHESSEPFARPDPRGLRGGRGSGQRRSGTLTPAQMAEQVGGRLPHLLQTLAATGAGGVRAMTVPELAETVRVAYDPAAGPVIEALRAAGTDSGVDWTGAGPAGVVEDWAGMRHDSGASITWQMTEAPRGAVQAQVLRALLEPSAGLLRKRVTLLYRPHDPAEGARIADADVRTALGRATSRAGEARATESVELRAARQTAAEEAGGAGLTRLGLLLTATVGDPAELPRAVDLIDQAAGASRVQLRRVYGGQSAAFAAALGVGVVLHRHVAVPAVLRDYL